MPDQKTIEQQLKEKINYTDIRNSCCQCTHFLPDGSTDNFGPGDRCGRNPDILICVSSNGLCDKYSEV